MEPKHRQSINTHCALIVRQIDIKALWPYLFINGIYNYDDCNVTKWTKYLTNPETIKKIILTIKTRGPYAFYELLRSLEQSDQKFLADILTLSN